MLRRGVVQRGEAPEHLTVTSGDHPATNAVVECDLPITPVSLVGHVVRELFVLLVARDGLRDLPDLLADDGTDHCDRLRAVLCRHGDDRGERDWHVSFSKIGVRVAALTVAAPEVIVGRAA